MTEYDVFSAAWRTTCHTSGDLVPVTLTSFRTIERLAGPARPPAYCVRYRCPMCDDMHTLLLTEGQLDVAPVLDPAAVHHDLMTGRSDWGSDLRVVWQRAFQRGRWPLTLTCRAERETVIACDEHGALGEIVVAPQVAGWPSTLRQITPDSERRPRSYEVQYECPRCSAPGCELWPARRLSLLPPL